MRQKIFLLSTLTFVLFSVFGCPKPDIKISGYVKSVETYAGISGAKVELGDKSVTTDETGFYSLSVPKRYKRKFLKISAQGFISYQNSPKASSGEKIAADAFLKPTDKTQTIDPAVENVVKTLDGAEVRFPVLSGITENLVVSLTNFHVSTDDIQSISGDFSAIDAAGANTNIYSMGMINVEIKGEDTGENYSLEDKGDYTIKIPVTGNKDSLPPTIPLWFFDTAQNKWVEQGTATLDATKTFYEGTVTHFTTWNADVKFTANTAVSGKIVDPVPGPGETYRVSIKFDGFYRSYTQTDSDFTIINLPQNKQMTVEVKKISTGEVWGKVIPPITSATYDAGNFPEANYFSEVVDLAISKAKNQFTLNWRDAPYGNFEQVRIQYNKIGEPVQSVLVPKGTETYTVSGLTSGDYTFTITALYTGGDSSKGITKNTYVFTTGDTFVLTIDLFAGSVDSHVLVNGVEYTGSMNFASGTTVKLKAVETNADEFERWYGDGIDDSNKKSNPVDIIMDGNKEILAQFLD